MMQGTIARGLALIALTAVGAMAQQTISAVSGTATAVIRAPNGVAVAGAFASGPMQMNRLTGQPYSAQQETQTVQTLADGTHITNGGQKMTLYRDSLGRTRTERSPMRMPGLLGADGAEPPVFIEVVDPVAGLRYSFDSNNRTAHRMPFGPMPNPGNGRVVSPPAAPSPAPLVRAMPAQLSASASRVRPEMAHEALGTQTIEGVLAEGTRTTTVYPVGFFGNDRPITSISERWFSRELGMEVLTKTSDPRMGESTMRLTNISRAEPDPSLFEPPAGYEIIDAPGAPVLK